MGSNYLKHLAAFWLAVTPVAYSYEPLAGDLHQQRARQVMAFIEENYDGPGGGLFSAKPGGKEPEMIWGNGILFSAYVGGARHDKKLRRGMDKFFEALEPYWDTAVEIPGYEPTRAQGGKDKYYDDNAWMVLTFLEAYQLTEKRAYKKRAEETLEFVLSGWDDEAGGGIWWHEQHKDGSKNTCVNAPAALSCFQLAKFEEGERAKELVQWGGRITDWTVEKFQDQDGLFWDAVKVKSGHINKGKLTYNTGLMQRNFIALNVITGKDRYLAEAKRVAKAAEFFRSRRTGGFRDAWKWSHLQAEADLELYRMTGQKELLDRVVKDAEVNYEKWKEQPRIELIDLAGLARELWLLADLETDEGRAFWEAYDGKTVEL